MGLVFDIFSVCCSFVGFLGVSYGILLVGFLFFWFSRCFLDFFTRVLMSFLEFFIGDFLFFIAYYFFNWGGSMDFLLNFYGFCLLFWCCCFIFCLGLPKRHFGEYVCLSYIFSRVIFYFQHFIFFTILKAKPRF